MEKMTAQEFILALEKVIEKRFLRALSYNDTPRDKLTVFLLQEWHLQLKNIQTDLLKIQGGYSEATPDFFRKITRQVILGLLAKHLQINLLRDDYEAFFLHWREYVFLAYQQNESALVS